MAAAVGVAADGSERCGQFATAANENVHLSIIARGALDLRCGAPVLAREFADYIMGA